MAPLENGLGGVDTKQPVRNDEEVTLVYGVEFVLSSLTCEANEDVKHAYGERAREKEEIIASFASSCRKLR